jgi:hypothetical protein
MRYVLYIYDISRLRVNVTDEISNLITTAQLKMTQGSKAMWRYALISGSTKKNWYHTRYSSFGSWWHVDAQLRGNRRMEAGNPAIEREMTNVTTNNKTIDV